MSEVFQAGARAATVLAAGIALAAEARAQATVETLALSESIPSVGRLGGLTIDREGRLYVANFRASVWRIDPDGTVTHLTNQLRGTSGNTVDPDGRLLQAVFVENRVVSIGPDGTLATVVEGAPLEGPVGVAAAPDGTLYVCSCQNHTIVRARDGKGEVFASGPEFACPNGITFGPDGELYVVSFSNGHVVRVEPDGSHSVLATLPGEGNAHIALAGGHLWVTQAATNALYRVSLDGDYTAVVGPGEAGLDDGPASEATMAVPNGIVASPDGTSLFVNNLEGSWRGEDPTEIHIRRIGPVASLVDLEPLRIPVGDFVFDALAAGPEDGEPVLLLHGFPQTSYAFRHQLRALGRAGYRAVAPDQRGYSPDARPDAVSAYAMGQLVRDVHGIATALGFGTFHLVGHDWGGAVAWAMAGSTPDRLRSLTVLSTPHFAALSAGRNRTGSDQARRSSYFADFAEPDAWRAFLADDAAGLRGIYGGLESDAVEVYLSALGTPEALSAALAWYGAAFGGGAASGGSSPTTPPTSAGVAVRTLYVWGTEDSAFGREAAEATRNHVSGPYRFVPIEGAGHWLMEAHPARISELLLEHLGSYEAGPF